MLTNNNDIKSQSKDNEYYSKKFLVELSFSLNIELVPEMQNPVMQDPTMLDLTVQEQDNKKWEIKDAKYSLEDLMKDSKKEGSENFIRFDVLEKEQYWIAKKEKIHIFNEAVKKVPQDKIKNWEILVLTAYKNGKNIKFVTKDAKLIKETTKLIITAISARSQTYYQQKLRDKIKRFILPEITATLDSRDFLIIPSIVLWDCKEKNKNSQFVTVSLFFLPKIHPEIGKDSFPLSNMVEFINKISQPKRQGILFATDNNTNFYRKQLTDTKFFFDFLEKLIDETCYLLKGKYFPSDKEEYADIYPTLMVSIICDYYSNDKICYFPDFSHPPEKIDQGLAQLTYDILYKFGWMIPEIINEKPEKSDIVAKLSHSQIIHIPQNISCFFSGSRHLSLTVLLSSDFFPTYSGIWAFGSETLANESISTQLNLIHWYYDKIRGNHKTQDSSKSKELRTQKGLDFEPLYNMETDDYYLNDRIERMQSKMGIPHKYQVLEQSLQSLSSVIIEEENKIIQIQLAVLTFALVFLGVITLFNEKNLLNFYLGILVALICCFVISGLYWHYLIRKKELKSK